MRTCWNLLARTKGESIGVRLSPETSDCAVISVAGPVNLGKITATEADVSILTGLTTNTVTKAAFAAILGRPPFFLRVFPGLILMILAAWPGLLLSR